MVNGDNGRETKPSGLMVPQHAQRELAAQRQAEFSGLNIWSPEDALPEAPAGTGHLHWTIQAFMAADKDGSMTDVSIIEVEAASEPEAIARAMQVIQRNGYRVLKVAESCSLDPDTLQTEVSP